MRYIIRGVPEREDFHRYLRERLPDAEWCIEQAESRGPAEFTATLGRAIRMQGKSGAVHLDDDVILTRDFEAKVVAAVGPYWTSIVSLYSTRKTDGVSKWCPASDFLHGPALYIPGSIAPTLADRFDQVVEAGVGGSGGQLNGHRVDQGYVIAVVLRERGQRFRVHAPSLVQHRATGSTLGHPTKYAGRPWQSPTFTDPWE